MLNVTDRAAAVLKAAKKAQGAAPSAGVRIVRGALVEDSGRQTATVGFAISDDPRPDDGVIEKNGLNIFVEDVLIEPLDGRTLDVENIEQRLELIFR